MSEHISLSVINLLLALSGLLALWIGWLVKARPKVKRGLARVGAVVDVFAGRPEEIDEVSGIRLPEIKPLHHRLTTIEVTLDKLANQERILSDHEARIVSLEDVEAERALTREESAAVWRAIANRDAIEGESE